MLGLSLLLTGAATAVLVAAFASPIAGLLVLGAFWLIALAVEKTYTIYGVEGEHQTPYMTRLVLGRLRFHIFWRGDADPDPHDHPWGFWTFPFVTYEEEVTAGVEDNLALAEFLGLDPGVFVTRNIVKRFRIHYRPPEHTHRVIGAVRETTGPDDPFRKWEPTGKPIVTIVWTEKVSREWGFLKHRGGIWCWVPWRKYIFEGGKDAPCAPEDPSRPYIAPGLGPNRLG